MYQSVLRRIDEFLDTPLPKAVAERERRAKLVLGRHPRQPDPLLQGHQLDFDDVMAKMTAAAGKFNIDRVKPEEVTRAAGPPSDED